MKNAFLLANSLTRSCLPILQSCLTRPNPYGGSNLILKDRHKSLESFAAKIQKRYFIIKALSRRGNTILKSLWSLKESLAPAKSSPAQSYERRSKSRTKGPQLSKAPRKRPLKRGSIPPASPGARPMKSHIQFVTVPSADTPGTALLLVFQEKRYCFGQIHEGLQRAGLQHGAKFLKVQDYFMTGRTEWANTGGLLGMILSIADGATSAAAARADIVEKKAERARQRQEEEEALVRSGKRKGKQGKAPTAVKFEQEEWDPTLRIRSGPNLKHTLAAARSFIFRQGVPVNVEEFNEQNGKEIDENSPIFKDDKIMVWAMPIKPTSSEDLSGSNQSINRRKRSLDDFMGEQTGQGRRDSGLEQEDRHLNQSNGADSTQDFVVKEMFQSQWRYDKLVEKLLREVRLPAQVYIRDPHTKIVSSYEGPLPNSSNSNKVPNIPVLVREPWPGALITRLPPTARSNLAISYIVKTHEYRGRFRPEEAKRLGVPPGPLFRQLANGEAVQAKDGTTVTPDMVLEPSKEGGACAIIDLPSTEYLAGFLARPELRQPSIMASIRNYIWLLGPGVAQNEMFLKFLRENRGKQHIVSSPDSCSNAPAMTSAAKAFLRHHSVDPDRFPSLNKGHQPTPRVMRVGEPLIEGQPQYTVARQGLKLQIVPESHIDEASVVPQIDESEVLKEIPNDLLTSSATVRKDLTLMNNDRKTSGPSLPDPDAEITCLGTGSMLPSLYRNVSATLLRVPGRGTYLFDCGEGTLGQLRRMYSKSELQEIFEDLKLIWISHLHADHHLGITSVIKAWHQAVHGGDHTPPKKPETPDGKIHLSKKLLSGRTLFIVSNPHMTRWLEEYSSVEDFGFQHLVPLSVGNKPNSKLQNSSLMYYGTELGFDYAETAEFKYGIKEGTGLSNLEYCPVSHCWGANAVSVTFPSGFKFSYSGDCRPSRKFARIGKDSTVLLHEATFDNELANEAIMKKHSTIGEAISVGAAMGARRVLLTHFSQRYSKLPMIDDLQKVSSNLETAEDVSDTEVEPPNGPVDIAPDETSQNVLPRPQSSSSKLGRKAISKSLKGSAVGNEQEAASMESVRKDMKIGIAFDYMRVKVKDIELLEKFNPLMRELYKNEMEELSRPATPSSVQRKSSIKGKTNRKADFLERVNAAESECSDTKLLNER